MRSRAHPLLLASGLGLFAAAALLLLASGAARAQAAPPRAGAQRARVRRLPRVGASQTDQAGLDGVSGLRLYLPSVMK